jgi:hypothetical protein
MPTLDVVGSGIFPQRDLTLGAIETLQAANHVIYMDFPGAGELLRGLGVQSATPVNELYVDGNLDRDNYASITEALIGAAYEHVHVAALVQGHPWVGVTLTRGLLRAAEDRHDLRVTVAPAISSIDTLLVDLRMDPLERGCVVIDANRLLLFEFDVDPRLGLLIYHASSVGNSRTDYREPWSTNRLGLLQDFLVDRRGPSAPFVAASSASAHAAPSRVHHGELARLTDFLREIDYGFTLYVPHAASVGAIDRDFLALLRQGAG